MLAPLIRAVHCAPKQHPCPHCGKKGPCPNLPEGMAKVTTRAYVGSGFDRGHLCAAKDRSASAADCRATFYLTNVAPRSPASNRKGWARLEDYCRRLATEGKALDIAAGPAGAGG